jgi:hypothetical protein
MSHSREVGVLVRRTKVDNPWIDHVWAPAAVLEEAPQTAAWTMLSSSESEEIFYAGSAFLDLFPSETGNYRDNLIDGDPQVWVGLREGDGGHGVELVAVTADPTEGESLFETGLIVGKAPMPAEIAAWVAAYVDEHHVERVFQKRQRDKSGPDPRKTPGARGAGAGRDRSQP